MSGKYGKGGVDWSSYHLLGIKQPCKLRQLWTWYPSDCWKLMFPLFFPLLKWEVQMQTQSLQKCHSDSSSWKNRWPKKKWLNLSGSWKRLLSLHRQFPLLIQLPSVSTEHGNSVCPKESNDGGILKNLWKHVWRPENTHIGVNTSNRVCKHGIEESVSMKHKRKKIGKCKDGCE